ncbi:helix-turn-helix transcriptional regulator [Celeribacter sp. PS-C1]|uniref:helix-turn-helix domain-containing protein n=1 Tax=Celeribacter sp. PS-C1 TaxID=2820813 RepID=UPI002106CEE3|nr:helix-turn-helix transcriptional regulator [Celeribacter sp. PS-C1]
MRQLSKRASSISQLCRDLDINRTQFNRYLNGEAFPRPDVLSKICQYFDVDARILLEPLDCLTERASKEDAARVLSSFLFDVDALKVAPDAFPAGYYLHHRVSYFVPDQISTTLLQFYYDDSANLRIRGYMPYASGARIGLPRAAPARVFHGVVFRQLVGFAFMATMDHVPLMVLGGFEANYIGNPKYYFGSSVSTQDVIAPSPILMERLEPKLSVLVGSRHRLGIHERKIYAPLVRGFFDKFAPLR